MLSIKAKKVDIKREQELMKTPLCYLDLSIKGSWLEPCLLDLKEELVAKGLQFSPHFWLSDEWFCPDGIPGIAIPFYLLDPELLYLEKKHVGFVEGVTKKNFMKLLRHEAGHAFENAYKLRNSKERINAFGDSRLKKYPHSYRPQPYSKSYVCHLDSGYAQSHPDEDFAETFATVLSPGSNWKKRYSLWGALKKLEYMEQLLESLKGCKPTLRNKFRSDPIEKQNITLGCYLKRKSRKFNSKRPLVVVDYFHNTGSSFSGDKNSLPSVSKEQLIVKSEKFEGKLKQKRLSQYLKESKREVISKISEQVGESKYILNKVYQEVERDPTIKSAYLDQPTTQTKSQLLDLITQQYFEFIDQKRDRIIL